MCVCGGGGTRRIGQWAKAAISVAFVGRDGVYHDDLHCIKRYKVRTRAMHRPFVVQWGVSRLCVDPHRPFVARWGQADAVCVCAW